MKVIKTEAFSLSELKEAIILNGGDYFGLTNAELKSTYIKAKSKISKVILGVYYKYVYTNADKIGSRYYVDKDGERMYLTALKEERKETKTGKNILAPCPLRTFVNYAAEEICARKNIFFLKSGQIIEVDGRADFNVKRIVHPIVMQRLIWEFLAYYGDKYREYTDLPETYERD